MTRHLLFACIVITGSAIVPTTVSAQKKADDPQMLSLEVAALQTLHRLDMTDGQLEALAKLCKGAASHVKSTGQTKVTPAFVKTLAALRTALIDDDEKVDTIRDKLADIMDKDKIVLEDRVPISDSARKNASQAIRLMHPAQVLTYVQIMDEDEVDIVDILDLALERGKGLDAAKWKAIRDAAAAEAAWLVAGSDESRTKAAVKALTSILDQQHNAKSKNSIPALEKQVETLTATLDPFVILRNAMERDVAELLSNPRLPRAIHDIQEQRRKVAAVKQSRE